MSETAEPTKPDDSVEAGVTNEKDKDVENEENKHDGDIVEKDTPLQDSIKLTRYQLATTRKAVADGFWHTKSTTEEKARASIREVKQWRCFAVSGSMTFCFYLVVCSVIPLIILLATLLTIRRYRRLGDPAPAHNGTDLHNLTHGLIP